MLGPSTTAALLEGGFATRASDIGGKEPSLRDPDQVSRSDTTHPLPLEVIELDVRDKAAVHAAAAADDIEAIVNCSVLRHHPRLSFEVNVQGTYNAVSAAVSAGHSRFVNTGPVPSSSALAS